MSHQRNKRLVYTDLHEKTLMSNPMLTSFKQKIVNWN